VRYVRHPPAAGPAVATGRITSRLPSPHLRDCGERHGQRALKGGRGASPGDGRDRGARARARAYLEAGADCVYPIALWEAGAIARFTERAGGPVNVVRLPHAPSPAELAGLGVARVSWGLLLYHETLGGFADRLATLTDP